MFGQESNYHLQLVVRRERFYMEQLHGLEEQRLERFEQLEISQRVYDNLQAADGGGTRIDRQES